MSASYLPFLLVALPLVGALLLLLTARLGADHARRTALTNVLLTFALAAVMVARYEPASQARGGAASVDASDPMGLIQMRSELPWLGWRAAESGRPSGGPDVRLALGVDGLSLWLIALAAVLMIPAVLASWHAVQDRPAAFYALLLVLESGLIGVFAAQDIILFYVFFEFTLIPLFFLVGIWGGPDRRQAARKFFVYTLAGSVLTFLGLLAIVLSEAWMTGAARLTFSIPVLTASIAAVVRENALAARYWDYASLWIFLALFAGFAIKVPLFPFHTWLPLAHVEAPTAGSVLLAGVLLKIGTYGFLRFALPLVPGACASAFHAVAILAVIGIIYGALLALAQNDIKKLVAYSSVSHMGFCLLGLFAFNSAGLTGGLLQMVNHGLSTGALFAMVGMLYERYHTREIAAYGGLARKFPIMAFCMIVVVFSSIGLPGLNGFTGEITALLGMFQRGPLYATLGLTGIILGAWYMLRLVRLILFGELREPATDHHDHKWPPAAAHGQAAPADLNPRELLALAPVIVLIFWIGLWPQFFVSRMEPSIRQVVARLEEAGASRVAGPAAPTPGPEKRRRADTRLALPAGAVAGSAGTVPGTRQPAGTWPPFPE